MSSSALTPGAELSDRASQTDIFSDSRKRRRHP